MRGAYPVKCPDAQAAQSLEPAHAGSLACTAGGFHGLLSSLHLQVKRHFNFGDEKLNYNCLEGGMMYNVYSGDVSKRRVTVETLILLFDLLRTMQPEQLHSNSRTI